MTKTIDLGVVGDAIESLTYRIPRYATHVHLLGVSVDRSPVAAYLRFRGFAPAAIIATCFQSGDASSTPFEIPHRAYHFDVFNQSGVPVEMSAVFEIMPDGVR